jgi:hypothetical protein
VGDCLADSWTEDETFLAQMNHERRKDDISVDEFPKYHRCLEETLEEPSEVWSTQSGGEDTLRLYHFIRHYGDDKPQFWYVVVARETHQEEHVEILEAFPTSDSSLVERYRRGTQDVGEEPAQKAVARVVH